MPLIAAVFSGGLAGASIRLLLHGILRGRASSRGHWLGELVMACMLGAAIAVPIVILVDTRDWTVGIFMSGLTTYAAVSAALAYRRDEAIAVNPRASALVHFAGTYLAMIIGFLIIIGATRLLPSQ